MEAKKALVAILAAVLLVAASASAAAGQDDVTSDDQATLAGQVLIGPTCPVVRLDKPCLDKPYAATLSVQTPDGTSEVTQVTTDDQGQFSVGLEAGDYLIVPLTPPGTILPRGIPQTISLAPGDAATIEVHYDSGIR